MRRPSAPGNVVWSGPSGEPEKTTRLPHTTRSRQDLAFALLIRKVYPQREYGDAFEGKRYRPGQTIGERGLWPEDGYPAEPLLLEYAGSDRSGSGHRRSGHVYILHRFDLARFEWAELARASGMGVEWVETLKGAALRHLGRTQPDLPMNDADAVSDVLALLESKLETRQAPARRNVMGLLWEQFTARLVRERAANV